jgi:hypothetical protein
MWKLRAGALFALSVGFLATWVACGGEVVSIESPDAGGTASGDNGPSGNGPSDAGNAARPPCENAVMDGQETDVDCGGTACGKCRDGKACLAAGDCAGGACIANQCATPACNDLAANGDETDIDCGGPVCGRCTIGRHCIAATDCVSGTCNAGTCACPKGMTGAATAGGSGRLLHRRDRGHEGSVQPVPPR